jgi:TatD DNase family protein
MWIDSHAHLNDQAFENDWRPVIDHALKAGIQAILVVGFDLPSSEKAVEMASQEARIWAAVGVHPHDAKTWDQSGADRLRQLLGKPKVVALGEIGLDYHYNYSPREDQLRAFQEQLAIAEEYNKPIIIHNREAHQDTLEVLTGQRIALRRGVMHCFSGSPEMAAQCLKLGLYLSLAGPLTFPHAAKLREVAAEAPLNRLLVETDCPYLTPHPYRGQRNEPMHVELVGRKLAEVKGLPVEEVMEATSSNTKALFGIS